VGKGVPAVCPLVPNFTIVALEIWANIVKIWIFGINGLSGLTPYGQIYNKKNPYFDEFGGLQPTL